MTSIWPIIPALFLVLLASCYSQNYAGILSSPLPTGEVGDGFSWTHRFIVASLNEPHTSEYLMLFIIHKKIQIKLENLWLLPLAL